MNINTGEIKSFADLTDDEKASGKWVPATEENMAAFRERQKRDAQRAHNRLVRRESEAKAKPDVIAARLAKAEAKRERKRNR